MIFFNSFASVPFFSFLSSFIGIVPTRHSIQQPAPAASQRLSDAAARGRETVREGERFLHQSAVTRIQVCAFYSYSISRRFCTACRSPGVYYSSYLDVLSLRKLYSFFLELPTLGSHVFFRIKMTVLSIRCETSTSQDFGGSVSIISSIIYVCAFHSYSILRRILYKVS